MTAFTPFPQAWTTYIPSFTNFTLGNGTLTAAYVQFGKTIHASIEVVLGTTSAVSGDIQYTLPATLNSRYASVYEVLGMATMQASSGGSTVPGYAGFISSTTANIYVWNAAGTYAVGALTSSTVPFTWASGYRFTANLTYEAA